MSRGFTPDGQRLGFSYTKHIFAILGSDSPQVKSDTYQRVVPDTLQPFNPLTPHDAIKHHLASLKKDSLFLQLMVLEGKFLLNWFTNTW